MARLPGNSATISQPGRTSRSVYSVQNAAAIEYQEYNKENGNETCEDPSNSTRATPAQPNLSDDNLDDAFGPKTSNTSVGSHSSDFLLSRSLINVFIFHYACKPKRNSFEVRVPAFDYILFLNATRVAVLV
ncbi:hypothetical protein SCAR479_11421 [Seiridium cardinale]|uniref:Uncharacterized protein n=1 Tax=Seiridium cardinale TaxID=138064 RepID=A0ABR2XE29_9PEZI